MKLKEYFGGLLEYKKQYGMCQKTIHDYEMHLNGTLITAIGDIELTELKQVDVGKVLEAGRSHGRFGPFLGCSKYPDCKGIINITKKGEAPLPDMPKCPAVGCDGLISPRTSRFGKRFFSCSNFPDCDVIVNDLADLKTKYPDHPKTAYVKKKGVKGGGRFQQSPKQLSAELQAITGAPELTRGEVLKKVWEYIKKHKLQDSKNKRLIVPDAKLAKVFGSKEPVDMMRISSLIGPHLKK